MSELLEKRFFGWQKEPPYISSGRERNYCPPLRRTRPVYAYTNRARNSKVSRSVRGLWHYSTCTWTLENAVKICNHLRLHRCYLLWPPFGVSKGIEISVAGTANLPIPALFHLTDGRTDGGCCLHPYPTVLRSLLWNGNSISYPTLRHDRALENSLYC